MKVAIGTVVLATGTASGQPARLTGGRGSRGYKATPLIGAASPNLRDLGNISYTDTIEADYSYSTAALAQAAILSLRKAALQATGNLIYGDGAGAVTIGPALCISADLVEWTGVGFTLRYEIIATEAAT